VEQRLGPLGEIVRATAVELSASFGASEDAGRSR
jgi:hypothetical protein